MSFSPKLTEAFDFAHRIHAEQTRKGDPVPYILHPMAVAASVGEDGGSENEVMAALLHDCVEDGDGLRTLDDIRSTFGDEVAEIVWKCSDAHEHPKPPWRARKESFVASLRTAPPSVKRVVAADKVHNVHALLSLLEVQGADTWDAFTGKRDGTLWYYHAVLDALSDGWTSNLLVVLKREIEQLDRAAARA